MLTNEDLQAYFRAGNTGFWKLEHQEGAPPRLYTDELSNSLFGVTEALPPEACHRFITLRIHPQDRECFANYLKKLESHESEIIYRYLHPTRGLIYIRCTGRKIPSSESLICIIGYHQEAHNIIRFEKGKLLEDHLVQQNQKLIDENRSQSSYYADLLDTINFGVLSYTLPEREIVHMNAEAIRIYGLAALDSSDEVQSRLWKLIGSVVYADPSVPQQLLRLHTEDGSVDYECLIPNKNGILTPVLAKTEIFYTSDGKRTVLTTFLDISENITLKAALAEAESKNAIISAISKIYWTIYALDLQTDSFEEIVGGDVMHQLTGAQGRTSESFRAAMEQLVSPEDRTSMRGFFDISTLPARLQQEETLVQEYLATDGHWYLARFIVKQRDEQGNATNLLYVASVIDDKKQQELMHQRELSKSYQALSAALQQATKNSEIINSIATLYETIIFEDLQNDAYEVIITKELLASSIQKRGKPAEWRKQKIITSPIPQMQQEIDAFLEPSTLPERLKDKNAIYLEYPSIGEIWKQACFIVKKRNEGGTVTEILLIIREITEEKKQELAYQTQLLQAAENAARASEAKTDFLRRMSHDIRTPLNGMIGMIHLCNTYQEDAEKLAECKNNLLLSLDYLKALMDNVLDISKIESGSLRLEKKPFDLVNLLQKELALLRINAEEYGIQFSYNQNTCTHTQLLGSEIYLNRILMNLASNAIKYNKKGGSVTLSVTEISCDETTVVYEFICADTGIGMSEEFQRRAFEPFSREEKETLTGYSGSGIGLSIVKDIVDLMHGTIQLESKETVGTTFTIRLPFELDSAAQKQEAQTERPAMDFSGKRALLVEDNKINMEIAKIMLEEKGLTVEVAQNGKIAVEKFEQSAPGTFDYIFMDVMMPILNGLEATRQIRALAHPDAKRIPILAMTANAFQDDIHACLAAGMNAHLAKPLSAEQLAEALQQFAEKKA